MNKPNVLLWALVAAFAGILFANLAHASADPVADVRQIMAATVTTKSVKQAYLSGARDNTTAFQGALTAYKAVRAAEAAPVPPVVLPPSSGTVAPLTAIQDNFDAASAIESTDYPSGIGGGIAGPSSEDVGAFRLSCAGGQLLKDDPLLYPGQPGASHLHQFWGNTATNASSTYSSLRTTGQTTCGYSASPVNRTAYWMPAMLDGAGHAVKPYFINTYYKQVPAGSAACNTQAVACIGLPNGLRYVFGYNMKTMTGGPTDASSRDYYAMRFECWSDDTGTPAVNGYWHSIADTVKAGCPAGAHLVIFTFSPDCWDGKNLDSADHRSHMSYMTNVQVNGSWVTKCPDTHLYHVPSWHTHVHFLTDANFTAGKWHLASDEMMPGTAAGTTLHMDYFEAWSPTVKAIWQKECIDRHATCSGGDLGNGTRIKPIEHSPKQELVAI
jgi:hypothetical protein